MQGLWPIPLQILSGTFTLLAGRYHKKFKMNTWSQGILWPKIGGAPPPPAAAGLHGSYHRQICNLVELFTEHGRSSSPTFRLWDDFPVKIMTHWKSSCMSTTKKWNGLWQENQEIKAEFLPLLFATNRISYAHYLPVSVLLMNRPLDGVLTAFEQRDFVAKLSQGQFNGVWMDYTVYWRQQKTRRPQ